MVRGVTFQVIIPELTNVSIPVFIKSVHIIQSVIGVRSSVCFNDVQTDKYEILLKTKYVGVKRYVYLMSHLEIIHYLWWGEGNVWKFGKINSSENLIPLWDTSAKKNISSHVPYNVAKLNISGKLSTLWCHSEKKYARWKLSSASQIINKEWSLKLVDTQRSDLLFIYSK